MPNGGAHLGKALHASATQPRTKPRWHCFFGLLGKQKAMRRRLTPSLAVVLLSTVPAVFAQEGDVRELYSELRHNRGAPVMTSTQRFDLVNDRFEPGWHCDRDLLIREMTYAPPAWKIRIVDRDGLVRMRGNCADQECKTPNGDFAYFDDRGVLRALGWYVNGLKSGTWQRWNAVGRRLPDKQYAGLEWDEMQVRLGMASRTDLWMEMADK